MVPNVTTWNHQRYVLSIMSGAGQDGVESSLELLCRIGTDHLPTANNKDSCFRGLARVDSVAPSFGTAVFNCAGTDERFFFFKNKVFVSGERVPNKMPLVDVLKIGTPVAFEAEFCDSEQYAVKFKGRRVDVMSGSASVDRLSLNSSGCSDTSADSPSQQSSFLNEPASEVVVRNHSAYVKSISDHGGVLDYVPEVKFGSGVVCIPEFVHGVRKLCALIPTGTKVNFDAVVKGTAVSVTCLWVGDKPTDILFKESGDAIDYEQSTPRDRVNSVSGSGTSESSMGRIASPHTISKTGNVTRYLSEDTGCVRCTIFGVDSEVLFYRRSVSFPTEADRKKYLKIYLPVGSLVHFTAEVYPSSEIEIKTLMLVQEPDSSTLQSKVGNPVQGMSLPVQDSPEPTDDGKCNAVYNLKYLRADRKILRGRCGTVTCYYSSSEGVLECFVDGMKRDVFFMNSSLLEPQLRVGKLMNALPVGSVVNFDAEAVMSDGCYRYVATGIWTKKKPKLPESVPATGNFDINKVAASPGLLVLHNRAAKIKCFVSDVKGIVEFSYGSVLKEAVFHKDVVYIPNGVVVPLQEYLFVNRNVFFDGYFDLRNSASISITSLWAEKRKQSVSPSLVKEVGVKSKTSDIKDEMVGFKTVDTVEELVKSKMSDVEELLVKSKSPSIEEQPVKSKSPSIEEQLVKSKSPNIEEQLVKSKSPSIEEQLVKSKSPSIEEQLVKSKSPSIEEQLVKSKSPSVEEQLVKSKSPNIDEQLVKNLSSDIEEEMQEVDGCKSGGWESPARTCMFSNTHKNQAAVIADQGTSSPNILPVKGLTALIISYTSKHAGIIQCAINKNEVTATFHKNVVYIPDKARNLSLEEYLPVGRYIHLNGTVSVDSNSRLTLTVTHLWDGKKPKQQILEYAVPLSISSVKLSQSEAYEAEVTHVNHACFTASVSQDGCRIPVIVKNQFFRPGSVSEEPLGWDKPVRHHVCIGDKVFMHVKKNEGKDRDKFEWCAYDAWRDPGMAQIKQPSVDTGNDGADGKGTVLCLDDTYALLLDGVTGMEVAFLRENAFLFGISLQAVNLTMVFRKGDSLYYILKNDVEASKVWLGSCCLGDMASTYTKLRSFSRERSIPVDIKAALVNQLSKQYSKRVGNSQTSCDMDGNPPAGSSDNLQLLKEEDNDVDDVDKAISDDLQSVEEDVNMDEVSEYIFRSSSDSASSDDDEEYVSDEDGQSPLLDLHSVKDRSASPLLMDAQTIKNKPTNSQAVDLHVKEDGPTPTAVHEGKLIIPMARNLHLAENNLASSLVNVHSIEDEQANFPARDLQEGAGGCSYGPNLFASAPCHGEDGDHSSSCSLVDSWFEKSLFFALHSSLEAVLKLNGMEPHFSQELVSEVMMLVRQKMGPGGHVSHYEQTSCSGGSLEAGSSKHDCKEMSVQTISTGHVISLHYLP